MLAAALFALVVAAYVALLAWSLRLRARGHRRPDYELIARLERELGFADEPLRKSWAVDVSRARRERDARMARLLLQFKAEKAARK